MAQPGAGPHAPSEFSWITTTEAAPPVAPFDRGAPQTMVPGGLAQRPIEEIKPN